jgi:hypothetical protein
MRAMYLEADFPWLFLQWLSDTVQRQSRRGERCERLPSEDAGATKESEA